VFVGGPEAVSVTIADEPPLLGNPFPFPQWFVREVRSWSTRLATWSSEWRSNYRSRSLVNGIGVKSVVGARRGVCMPILRIPGSRMSRAVRFGRRDGWVLYLAVGCAPGRRWRDMPNRSKPDIGHSWVAWAARATTVPAGPPKSSTIHGNQKASSSETTQAHTPPYDFFLGHSYRGLLHLLSIHSCVPRSQGSIRIAFAVPRPDTTTLRPRPLVRSSACLPQSSRIDFRCSVPDSTWGVWIMKGHGPDLWGLKSVPCWGWHYGAREAIGYGGSTAAATNGNVQ